MLLTTPPIVDGIISLISLVFLIARISNISIVVFILSIKKEFNNKENDTAKRIKC